LKRYVKLIRVRRLQGYNLTEAVDLVGLIVIGG
jgi:hypothetical protein